MRNKPIAIPGFRPLYLTAWLIYIAFAILGYPVFSISVMLFSVALAMLGAWFYGLSGGIITTLLTIPFHALLLYYYDSWESPFNPFGISTQLLASGSIALLRHTKIKLKELTEMLEIKVNERTKELSHLQHYIMQNHETAQTVLSNILLQDIGLSLGKMKQKSDRLLSLLMFEGSPDAPKVSRLNDMISQNSAIIENLEFVDHFFSDQTTGFMSAVSEVADHFSHTAAVHFDLEIYEDHASIPRYIQHQLYRITQEAITNAVRHGKAENISVQLQIGEGCYRLSVINDGNPLPPKVESGLGLKLMQHRTQQLDGSLSWQTTEDGWTKLDCSIPQRPD